MLSMRLLLLLLLFWAADALVQMRSGKISCNNEFLNITYSEDIDEVHTCGLENIYVRIRTCDNCVQIDTGSVAGLTIANLIATILIGVGVKLVASGAKTPSLTSDSKSSDKKHLIPRNTQGRDPNPIYQDLHGRSVDDEYNMLGR